MPELTDNEILELFRKGSNPDYAFGLLVRKYQERIYYFVRRLVVDHPDADDVVQNVFIKVWSNLSAFREDSKLYTWIYRIALNECISFLRGKKLRSFITLGFGINSLAGHLHDDNFFGGDHAERKLQEAILKLPSKQRIVFNMRYYEGLNYEEMNEILGTSVGALKASYHLAVKKITDFVMFN